MTDVPARYREVPVPPNAAGMRLDRFLAVRFRDRSRTELQRGIAAGEVTDPAGKVLRASSVVRAGDVLHVGIEGIAPMGDAPPMPAVLYEDHRVIALDKPPGLMAHPSGTRFVHAVVGMARRHWDDRAVDIVHRLDKDTSGVLLLTKDREANGFLKTRMKAGACRKEYLAVTRGVPPWEALEVEAPIGRAGGPIRIQMGVVADGQWARTDFTVEARHPTHPLALVRCRLHTGRTHQIRVHLAHVGFPILGDLLYGVPTDVFLGLLETGLTPAIVRTTGAPRHALHAARLVFPHPDDERPVEVTSPLPADVAAWWADPGSAMPPDEPPVA